MGEVPSSLVAVALDEGGVVVLADAVAGGGGHGHAGTIAREAAADIAEGRVDGGGEAFVAHGEQVADGHDSVVHRLFVYDARYGYDACGVALVERGQRERLAIGEEIRLEGVLRHAIELCRGAYVGDEGVLQHVLLVGLVEDHLRVRAEVGGVVILLIGGVQLEGLRHQICSCIAGGGQVARGASGVGGRLAVRGLAILAEGALKEADFSLHGVSHIAVERRARLVVVHVFAGVIQVSEHLIHHGVAALAGAIERRLVVEVHGLIDPLYVAIVADQLVILPSAHESAHAAPVCLGGVAHVDAVDTVDEDVGAADLYPTVLPFGAVGGHVLEVPVGEAVAAGLVVGEGFEVEVAVRAAVAVSGELIVEGVGEAGDGILALPEVFVGERVEWLFI